MRRTTKLLIAFTILALVAGSICTMALNNLKAQKADVERMEARYEAEGELQRFIAEVEALTVEGAAGPSVSATENDAVSSMEAEFLVKVQGLATAQLTIDEDSAPDLLNVQAVSSDGTAEIKAVLKVQLDSDTTCLQTGEGENLQYEYICELEKATVTAYESYDISYEEVAE